MSLPKIPRWTVLGAMVFAASRAGFGVGLDPALAGRLRGSDDRAEVPVIAYLRPPAGEQADYSSGRSAFRSLRGIAHRTQGPLLALLARRPHSRARPLWIVNAVAFRARPDTIAEVARLSGVAHVSIDPVGQLREGVPTMKSPHGTGVAWNVALVRADALWSEGITGAGVRIGVIDTGVDATHPDLVGKMVPGGWFDAVNGRTTPYDDHGHGTHVTGTICGGAASGTAIGVAPGARFLSAKALDKDNRFTGSDILEAGQWMADPNGDGDPSDAPNIVSCSWMFDSQTTTAFHPMLQLWRAEGIWPVFAGGNSGPGAYSIGNPGSDPLAISVGATNSTDGIADFSSRGPAPSFAPFDGVLKPDVCAPGVLVLSSLPGGVYGSWSGTSMATPHVAGALALLRQALPGLSFDQAYERLTTAAVDRGAPGPDPAYGNGRIDAWAMVHDPPGYVPPAVSGIVCDTQAHPIWDAIVDVSGSRLVTGPDGRFSVAHVAPGTYTAKAIAPGYAAVSTPASPGNEVTLNLPAQFTMGLRDGFETDRGWTLHGGSGGGRVSNANRTPGGGWSLGFTSNGDGLERYFLSPPVSVASAGTVTLDATYVWRGTGNADGRESAIVWLNAAGNILAVDYGTLLSIPSRGGPADGVWRSVIQAYHLATPAGAKWARLRLGASFPTGDTTSAMWFDDATIYTEGAAIQSPTGDVNGDGIVSALDVAAALRIVGGLASDPAAAHRGDLWPAPADGRLTVEDVLAIARLWTGF